MMNDTTATVTDSNSILFECTGSVVEADEQYVVIRFGAGQKPWTFLREQVRIAE